MGGWLAGWLVGDDENKTNSAQLSCSLSWCWAELGKSKGREIRNETMHMADYLLPHCNLKITNEQTVIAMRNRITKSQQIYQKSRNEKMYL